jgi:hypothetical protein
VHEDDRGSQRRRPAPLLDVNPFGQGPVFTVVDGQVDTTLDAGSSRWRVSPDLGQRARPGWSTALATIPDPTSPKIAQITLPVRTKTTSAVRTPTAVIRKVHFAL